MKTNLKKLLVIIFTLSIGITPINAQKKGKKVVATKTSTTKAKTSKTSSVKTVSHSSTKSGFDLKKLQVGANIQFDITSYGNNKNTNVGLMVFGAYKLCTNFMAGIKVGETFRTLNSTPEIGVFGRYYINNLFLGTGITHSLGSYDYFNLGYNDNLTYGVLEAGYEFPVSNKIKIQAAPYLNLPFASGGNIWFGLKTGAVYNF